MVDCINEISPFTYCFPAHELDTKERDVNAIYIETNDIFPILKFK